VNTKQKSKLNGFYKGFVRHLKLVAVPHKANQYRPHLIRRYGLLAVLILVGILQVSALLPSSTAVLGSKAPVSASILLADTNRVRIQNSLAPLEINEKLSRAAFLKASDMFKKQYWAHTSPAGTAPWEWFGAAGYNYNYAGENLAKNFRSAGAIMTAWMASPEHRANILGAQYSQVGFATMDGKLNDAPATIVVALYGSPVESAAVTGVSVQAPPVHSSSLMTRFGVALQTMSPAALGSTVLLILVASVAMFTHFYRHKLPRSLRYSWYRHHGIAKAGGMLGLCIIVVFLYSGGQI